jgi:2-polyprenyl-3-methyl-5-hydroxy-6-metoxy-1,4-benzoquinol methylase
VKRDRVREYFEAADRYLHKPFGVRVRARIVRQFLGPLSNARILDIGCGEGSVSLQYLAPGNRITLVDVSEAMLERARANVDPALAGNVEVRAGDFQVLDGERAFDVVLCLGVLAHVDDVARSIRKVASLTRPGGRAVIQITDADSAMARFHDMARRVRSAFGDPRGYALNRTTVAAMSSILPAHGLAIARVCRYSVLLPGMGRLPDEWLFRFEMLSVRRPLLARLGFEVIFFCEKSGPPV